MNFEVPDWVGDGLREAYSNILERNRRYGDRRGRGEQALFERLIRPEMERPWSEVLKRSKSPGDPAPMIFHEVLHALEETKRPQRTRAEIAVQNKAIAKAARDFARAVFWSELDTAPFRWFPEEWFAQVLGMIRPELANGAWCPLGPPPGVEKGAVYTGPVFKRIDGEMECWPWSTEGGLFPFFDHMLKPAYPRMAEIAIAIAEEADSISKEAMSEPRILPKPNVANARRLIFVREFGSSIKLHCGTYLKRTLAKFAHAALDEEVTVEHINDALRGFEPIPFKYRKYSKDRPRATYLRPDDPRLK